MTNKQEFDAEGFYSALERSVRSRKVNWKDVSLQTGVSQTTLTRMAQGRRPDAASLAVLSAWAGINPANFVPGQMPRHTSTQTLEKVALLFRQDAQLSADAARKLEQIVETAYHAFKGEETAPQAVKKR